MKKALLLWSLAFFLAGQIQAQESGIIESPDMQVEFIRRLRAKGKRGEACGASGIQLAGIEPAAIPPERIEHWSSPCLALSPLAPFRALFCESLAAKGFGTFASERQNGFVAVMNCFMTVS